MSRETSLKVFKHTILPKFDYCAFLYDSAAKSWTEKIERTIIFLPKNSNFVVKFLLRLNAGLSLQRLYFSSGPKSFPKFQILGPEAKLVHFFHSAAPDSLCTAKAQCIGVCSSGTHSQSTCRKLRLSLHSKLC